MASLYITTGNGDRMSWNNLNNFSDSSLIDSATDKLIQFDPALDDPAAIDASAVLMASAEADAPLDIHAVPNGTFTVFPATSIASDETEEGLQVTLSSVSGPTTDHEDELVGYFDCAQHDGQTFTLAKETNTTTSAAATGNLVGNGAFDVAMLAGVREGAVTFPIGNHLITALVSGRLSYDTEVDRLYPVSNSVVAGTQDARVTTQSETPRNFGSPVPTLDSTTSGAGFSYQVDLSDPNDAGGTADGVLVYDLEQALSVWAQHIVGLGTLVVQLNFDQTSTGRAGGIFTSSYYVGTRNGINLFEPSSLYELTTGQHVSGTTSDITITVSPSYIAQLDLAAGLTYSSAVPTTEFNPIVIFLHELMHGFGMAGWYDLQTGTLPGNYESTFDSNIQITSSGLAYFAGANADAAFGGSLPLTTTNTSQNYYHLGNTQSDAFLSPANVHDPLTLDLMNGVVFFWGYQYQISAIDFGILKDLGYNIVTTSAPTISTIAVSGPGIVNGNGDLNAGKIVTFTVTMSEAVTVSTAYGSPSLQLSDGGIAVYSSGSGTSTLTFSYTVAAGQNSSDLDITALALNGSTISDSTADAASISGAANYKLAGIIDVDTTSPAITGFAEEPDGGSDLNAGKMIVVILQLSESVSVSGIPTLQLNDNEVGTYTAGSGTNALTFTYTVQPGDNTPDLQVTGLNLPNGASIEDAAGNNLSGPVTADLALQINTFAPSVSSLSAVTDSGATTVGAGHFVTITLEVGEPLTVTGTPSLQLNDNEVGTYTAGSGTNTLTFTYTVQPSDNTPDLQVTDLNLPNGASIQDAAGNNLSGSVSGDLHLEVFTPLTAAQTDAAYQSVLQRLPTAAEVNAAVSVGSATAITTVVDSAEAQFNVYPIVQIIKLALGTDPTPHQLAGWVPFVETNGLLQGQSQTNPLLDQMATAFVASDNFGKVYNNGVDVDPNSPVTAQEMQIVIQAATGVAATQNQINAWLSTGLTIDQVFVDFALGDQYTAFSQTANQQFLTTVADNAAGIQVMGASPSSELHAL
jgi:hypothetical protein